MSVGNKIYHFECESSANNSVIAIRMFQYDVAVALEGKRKEKEVYVVEFPASCVIYLRHNGKTKSQEQVLVRMPDGREMAYVVPVVKSQEYTREDIFEKKLYVLLPYYILRYEKQLEAIEKETERRRLLLEEYDSICTDLRKTLGKENPLGYSELHKLMVRLLEYILKKKEKTRKGVQQVMGGHVLESWKEEMIRIGRTEGLAEGHAEGHAEAMAEQQKKLEEKVCTKLGKGKSVAQIAEELEEEVSIIERIYQKIVNEKI